MTDTDPAFPAPPSAAFRAGDCALLVDSSERTTLVQLTPGKRANIRGKQFEHDDLIGLPPGSIVYSKQNTRFHLLRPTLAEYQLSMKRFTAIIYPKDLGALYVDADLFPGARVLEAGMGSGATTLFLCRAVGATGEVVSYEVRAESRERATQNLDRWFQGPPPNHTIREHDIYEGIPDQDVDRIVLDLPEPWRVAEFAGPALRPGGIFAAYLPTIPQVERTARALRSCRWFLQIHTKEILERAWAVEGRSVRPDHRMIGHTGFLITARRAAEPRPLTRREDPETSADD